LTNLTPREKCYEEHSASGQGCKWQLLFGGKALGIAVQMEKSTSNGVAVRTVDRSCWCGANTDFLSVPSLICTFLSAGFLNFKKPQYVTFTFCFSFYFRGGQELECWSGLRPESYGISKIGVEPELFF